MQFADVIGYGQKDALCQYILPSTIQIPAEIHILIDHGKAALSLDTSVHPQLGAVFSRDPGKARYSAGDPVLCIPGSFSSGTLQSIPQSLEEIPESSPMSLYPDDGTACRLTAVQGAS